MTPVRTFKDASGSVYDVPESDIERFRAEATPDTEEIHQFRDDADAYDVPVAGLPEFRKDAGSKVEQVYTFRDDSGELFDVPQSGIAEFTREAKLDHSEHPVYRATAAETRRSMLEAKREELDRDLTDEERAKVYYDDAVNRGDIATAKKLIRGRTDLDIAKRDLETTKSDIAAVRKPYLAVRGTMGGLTLGASDVILGKVEEKAIGDRVQAESMSESVGENIGRMLGSIFTGGGIASGTSKVATTGKLVKASDLSGGVSALIAKTGARPLASLIATRAVTSLATMAPQEAASVLNGDKPVQDAVRDTAINALGSVVGAGPEIFVRKGIPNFLAQVMGQLAFDAAVDAKVTGRLTPDNIKEWMVNELPNLATAVVFAAKDLTDGNFKEYQDRYRKDAAMMFARKVKESVAEKPFEYGVNVEQEGGKTALEISQSTKKPIERYPLDTHENVTAAITDLKLDPSLKFLNADLDNIRLELKAGERVAGRMPQKNDQGEIIGWMDAGAAYPGGLGADTIPAIRNYLEGKPLTENQQRQLAAAVKHLINEQNGQAGFDIANQTPVYSEEMRPGDTLSMEGEKFTVKDIDPDTGNITLKDGKLVTLKPGETVLADRDSHLDVEGKPTASREPLPRAADATDTAPASIRQGQDDDISFNPDEFESGPTPVRYDLDEGFSAERTPEGGWEMIGPDGTRQRLDPTVADDHALIMQLDPDARAGEVKRIAQETADKLPGAKIHFVDDEASMGDVRAQYGDAVKDIKAENGATRGFAVTSTGDYYILTRNMSPAEAERTVLHEAVGHIGVRGVLGDRFDRVMDGILDSQIHMRLRQELKSRYKMDTSTPEGRRELTEEVIAHIAENKTRYPNAWNRLVARVKDVFRNMGFQFAQDWTENDVLNLIHRAKSRISSAESSARADKDVQVRFSKAKEEWNASQQASDKRFQQELSRVRAGNFDSTRNIEVGITPRILTAVGADPLPIVIPPSVASKATTGKHAITWEEMAKLPGELRDPIMVFKSKSEPDSIVVMTEMREGRKTVVVAVELNRREQQHEVNSIRSLYGKENDGIFTQWIKDKMLLYRNTKKSLAWFRSRGLQLPKEGTTQGSGNKILTEADVVNPDDIRLAKRSDSGLTAADRSALTAAAKKRFYGRPDLAQMGESKQVRNLGAEVDQMRNEKGEPTPQAFATWKIDADTRLQTDTTGEWLNLLSGKLHYEGNDAGQNTMVARKLIETKGLEAFASGDDAEIAKIGAAMWQYRNTRSNLARALAAGRDFQETPAERNRRFIAEALYYPGANVDRKLQGMDLEQMHAELKKRAGQMQKIRTKLLDMGIDIGRLDEKTLNDPHSMAEIVRQIQISNAGFGDMAYEYWRNSILSAPTTHVANIMGNTASLTWNYTAQKATEAMINVITGNKQGTTFGELPGMWRALRDSQRQAARNAVIAFSTEQAVIEGIRLEEKGVAIGGKTGRVVRTPQRILLAADEYAKTMILQAEIYSRAYQEAHSKGWRKEGLERRIKEILADPKSDMVNDAMEETRKLVFQAEPGAITQYLLQSRKVAGLGWVAKFALPFVTTPSNILKTGLQKSPLGILRMGTQAVRGEYQGNRKALVHDAAEQLLAWAGTAALWSIVNDDDETGLPRITGSRPSGGANPGKLQALQREAPAQSIRIGGKWYSYARIEPLATAITFQVDLLNAIRNRNGENSAERLSRVFSSMRSIVRDKTYLAAVGDIIRSVEDDAKGLAVVHNFMASWSPNIVRTAMRAMDPYSRDYKLRQRDDRGTIAEFASNVAQASAPLPRFQDAPRLDYWGRPIAKSEGLGHATDILWRMVSPIQIQTVKTPENFDRFLFNFNRKAAANGWDQYWPSMPDSNFKLEGKPGFERDAAMNPDEYATFLKRRGELFFAAASKRKWNFDNPNLSDRREFSRLMENAGEKARNEIRKSHSTPASFKLLQSSSYDSKLASEIFTQ
jgi:hypothetical protein